ERAIRKEAASQQEHRSISRDFGIDVARPALDSSGQGLGFFESLKTQPRRRIQASHAVMAITNQLVHVRKDIQAGRKRAQRYKFRAFNAANLEFPGLPHIHDHHLFATVKPGFHFRWRNLQFRTLRVNVRSSPRSVSTAVESS